MRESPSKRKPKLIFKMGIEICSRKMERHVGPIVQDDLSPEKQLYLET